jgi:hypothetical protein
LLLHPDDRRHDLPLRVAPTEHEEPEEEPRDGEEPEQRKPRPDVALEQPRRPGIDGRRRPGRGRERLFGRRDGLEGLRGVAIVGDATEYPKRLRKIPPNLAS